MLAHRASLAMGHLGGDHGIGVQSSTMVARPRFGEAPPLLGLGVGIMGRRRLGRRQAHGCTQAAGGGREWKEVTRRAEAGARKGKALPDEGATCEDTWSEQVEKKTSGVGPNRGPVGV